MFAVILVCRAVWVLCFSLDVHMLPFGCFFYLVIVLWICVVDCFVWLLGIWLASLSGFVVAFISFAF